jgi:methylglyoxal reductase
MSPHLPLTGQIPDLGLGTFPFSGVFSPVTPAAASAILDAFRDAGGWYIETAPVYSPNAIPLGDLISRYPREDVFIATKCVTGKDHTGATIRSGKAAHLRNQCHSELQRLQVDYLDLLQLHTVPEDAAEEESFGTLSKLKDEGLVRNIGVSNVSVEQLQRFNTVAPVDMVQNRFSYLHRTNHRSIERYCAENGILLNPYQVIERGLLTDHSHETFRDGDLRDTKFEYRGDVYHYMRAWVLDRIKPLASRSGSTVSHLAIGWALAQPSIGVIPLGATSPAQARSNMDAPRALPTNIITEMDLAYEELEERVRERFGLTIDEYRGL